MGWVKLTANEAAPPPRAMDSIKVALRGDIERAVFMVLPGMTLLVLCGLSLLRKEVENVDVTRSKVSDEINVSFRTKDNSFEKKRCEASSCQHVLLDRKIVKLH